MTSITDVYNQLVQANTTLGQLHADILAETSETTQVKASVDTLTQIEIEAVKLLFHLTQQADATICALEHISENTCAILNQVTIQTGLQIRLAEDIAALRFIGETTHPDAVLERERLGELRAQIERCCPPETSAPACTYEPCPRPRPVKEPKIPRIPGSKSPR